eukprot:gb/GECH01011093.1/.p1 GENE.gb/GECH01011093.1/~~gb/GECH01011093.1/.p1  ORF type:complete len:115 (+),score=8.22 gb/GECH01011093.1/:1-345(+)
MSENWKHGTFNCLDDIGKCAYGTFCPPCAMATSEAHFDENSTWFGNYIFHALFMAVGLEFFYMVYKRNQIREGYNIEGSIVNDALLTCCCGCCSNVQILKETTDRGTARGRDMQ